MLTKRIIACLDCTAGRVVKGVQFVNLQDAGDPAELAAAHAKAGADEIVLLDITATHERRKTLADTVRRTARALFVPFTVGGGISSLADASSIFEAGADKITINSAALADPTIITDIAKRFGSQAVIIAIDAKGDAGNEPVVYVSGGRKPTPRRLLEWAKEAEDRGAGEILYTSMDRDGMRAGFDCTWIAALTRTVSIPVIASGGAGSIEHFVDVFKTGKADAALAASIFHFGIHSMADLKTELISADIPIRWPV